MDSFETATVPPGVYLKNMELIYYMCHILSKLERIIIIIQPQTPEDSLWNVEESERCFLYYYKSEAFASCSNRQRA